MSNLKLAGGSSSKNSVTFFLKESGKGIEAVRKEDGTIVTKEVDSDQQLKLKMKVLKIIFVFSLFREFSFLLNLPRWFYHTPTVLWIVLFLIAVLVVLVDDKTRTYHGAEHKVAHWHKKKNKEYDMQGIKKCSRIHGQCGSNLLATIVTFQIASSMCLELFNFHIPEILTAILPFYVYNIFPFNLLGLVTQVFTTANPSDEQITVALRALSTLLESE